jgi:hypothetical protein
MFVGNPTFTDGWNGINSDPVLGVLWELVPPMGSGVIFGVNQKSSQHGIKYVAIALCI